MKDKKYICVNDNSAKVKMMEIYEMFHQQRLNKEFGLQDYLEILNWE